MMQKVGPVEDKLGGFEAGVSMGFFVVFCFCLDGVS